MSVEGYGCFKGCEEHKGVLSQTIRKTHNHAYFRDVTFVVFLGILKGLAPTKPKLYMLGVYKTLRNVSYIP